MKSAKADLLPSVSVQGEASRTNDDWNPFDHEAINNWQIQGILSWTLICSGDGRQSRKDALRRPGPSWRENNWSNR